MEKILQHLAEKQFKLLLFLKMVNLERELTV